MELQGHQTARFVDLSHEVHHGMAVFPGLPSPRIFPISAHKSSRSRCDGKAEYLEKVEPAGNTATYIDTPFHRYRNGAP